MYFYYKLILASLKKRNNKSGFTLAELIISGFVSLLVLIAGFTLLRMNIQVNKSDEINLKLGGKINNALDFIVDEINSSKGVITSYTDVPSTCRPLPQGDLVLALKMPDQAKSSSAYQTKILALVQKQKPKLDSFAKDCPIL